jgi:hypothetical protein
MRSAGHHGPPQLRRQAAPHAHPVDDDTSLPTYPGDYNYAGQERGVYGCAQRERSARWH